MTDLVEFLRARLDEDAEVAQEKLKNEQRVPGTDRWFASHSNAITSMAPHRAVIEVEAKRKIVNYESDGHLSGLHIDAWGIWRDQLKFLTLPYADHPDYREEWKP